MYIDDTDIVKIEYYKKMQIFNTHFENELPFLSNILYIYYRNNTKSIVDLTSGQDITTIEYYEYKTTHKPKVIFKEIGLDYITEISNKEENYDVIDN